MLSKSPPFPLLLWEHCPYLQSIHPSSHLRNASNNAINGVSFKTGCLEWLVWFAISYSAVCEPTCSSDHSRLFDRQMEPSVTSETLLLLREELYHQACVACRCFWRRWVVFEMGLTFGREGGVVVPTAPGSWLSWHWELWFPGPAITGSSGSWPYRNVHPVLLGSLEELSHHANTPSTSVSAPKHIQRSSTLEDTWVENVFMCILLYMFQNS